MNGQFFVLFVVSPFASGFFFVVCLQHVRTLCLVRDSNISKLGHGVEVRVCYSSGTINKICDTRQNKGCVAMFLYSEFGLVKK